MEEEIREFLEENHQQFGLPEVEFLELDEGKHNFNAVLSSGKKHFIARISMPVTENQLENEARMLDLLEKHGVENVPRKKSYQSKTPIGPVLVESFEGEKDLESEDLNRDIVLNVARLLAETHAIPVEDYNQLFDADEKETVALGEVYQRDFQKWSKERFKKYLENVDEPDERLNKHIELQEDILQSVDLQQEVTQTVVHGDAGFNFRVTGNTTYLIDWEFGRVGYPVHEILYTLDRFSLDDELENKFLSEYRKHRDLDIPEPDLELYPQLLKLNDAVWAAMRMVKAEGEEREKFGDIYEKKIKKLEEFQR